MTNVIKETLLDKIRKQNKTIHFNITNRCNIKCKHCINTNGETVLGEVEEDKVLFWLTKVSELGYKNVNIVGGEPFLRKGLLKKIVNRANELRLYSCITTNAYWADTILNAETVISELKEVNRILVSTDFFHLENIPLDNIRNAIAVCREHSIFIAINAVCCTKKQRQELQELFKDFPKDVFVNFSSLMPFGAAKELVNELEYKFLPMDIEQIPSYCDVEENYVDCKGGVYTCCMSTLCTITKQLYFGNLQMQGADNIIHNKENNLIYQLISQKGIRGLVEVLGGCENARKYLKNKYSSQCEFCVSVLNDQHVIEELEKII